MWLGYRRVGKCISVFTNNRIPYCVKFNPDPDKQNFFLAGCSDKKIIQVRGAHDTLQAAAGTYANEDVKLVLMASLIVGHQHGRDYSRVRPALGGRQLDHVCGREPPLYLHLGRQDYPRVGLGLPRRHQVHRRPQHALGAGGRRLAQQYGVLGASQGSQLELTLNNDNR